MGEIRRFSTGATRDASDNKADLCGFTSALVTKRFGEYMLGHQVQSDGQRRPADNWKRGIPKDQYLESLRRHVEDVALVLEGFPEEAREPLEDALCACLFNVQGLLYEVLKEKRSNSRETIIPNGGIVKPQTAIVGEWHGQPIYKEEQ